MKGNIFANFKNTICEKFGPNPAKMLIYTGVLGWFLSSAAQVMAIVFNDKIPKEQKSYLIPQEIADGAVNVISFFAITTSIKAFASKLVSTGKIASPKVRAFLQKNDLNRKDVIGDVKFDISKLQNFDKIKPEYTKFKNGIDVLATTGASVLSCNIVTPILRNKIAADRQQASLAKMSREKDLKAPRGLSIEQYQNIASYKFGSTGLRV